MCGIIGFIGEGDFNNIIINGLSMLQNRGYDSVGVSYIDNQEIITVKKASTLDGNALKTIKNDLSVNTTLSIGHTRWATHGPKTDINAHPHNDTDNIFSLVHNGIIENYRELKDELINEGYVFKSQTDTEVIVALLSKNYEIYHNVYESIENTIKLLKGTWALAIITKLNPNKLWITRCGSPLLLSINDSYAIISSEQSGFCNNTTCYNTLNDHCIVELEYIDNKIKNNINWKNTIETNYCSTDELSPYPYDHYMIKEIMSQQESVLKTINNGGRIKDDYSVKLGGLDAQYKRLFMCNHLLILGCGTSLNAGQWSVPLFKKLNVFESVNIYDASDLTLYDIPDKCAVIMLSQSGETRDLIKCFDMLDNCTTIGVVNVVDSEISRRTNCGIYLNVGKEFAVASTKSFTSQCVALTLIAIWFSQHHSTCPDIRYKLINDIRNLSYDIKCILDHRENVKNILPLFSQHNMAFVLGKSSDMAIANECSLKLKEIAYINAQGYSSSALKHGPFALIDKDFPIIVIDTLHEYHDCNMNAVNEVQSRNAKVILLSNNSLSKFSLPINKNNTFGGVLANIYVQILSYEIALEQKRNPDFPKNLAKVVTVD